MVAEQDFIQYLLELGLTFDTKPVLFPTNDHWAMAISRHKEALREHYRPCVADWSAVEMLIRKRHFYKWAFSNGYPVPQCWTDEELNLIPNDAFPIVAKPEHRRVSSNTRATRQLSRQMDRLRLTVLRNRSQLDEFVLDHDDLLEHFLFLEYVEGLSDCMYTIGVYAAQDYEVLGLFTGRKVRGFPPDIGDCIVGQVEEVPQRLKDMVKQMCQEIGYHGIAEFEFKRDAATGEFKLIEINPRSWSWVGITPACGVSLPWIAYADLTGIESIAYTESQMSTGNVKWVRMLEDLPNCLFKNRRAGYPDWYMTLREWRQSLQAERLVVAEFAADDPLPGGFSLISKAKQVLRGCPLITS
jgi:predicted ATP-grasp superfamily ATP-dependent carboligase